MFIQFSLIILKHNFIHYILKFITLLFLKFLSLFYPTATFTLFLYPFLLFITILLSLKNFTYNCPLLFLLINCLIKLCNYKVKKFFEFFSLYSLSMINVPNLKYKTTICHNWQEGKILSNIGTPC